MNGLPLLEDAFVGTLLGAFLGAFFGYLFTLILKARETKFRRIALFEILAEESFLAADYSTMYSEQQRYLSPIGCSAAKRLLDGETLSYSKHGITIQNLLELVQQVSAFNQAAEWSNTNFYRDTKVHTGELSRYLEERHVEVVKAWLAVLAGAPEGALKKVDEAVSKLQSRREKASSG